MIRIALALAMLLLLLLLPACGGSAGEGVLSGQVTIGPLSPVTRPGDTPQPVPPEVYAARKIMVYDARGNKLVREIGIGADGRYHAALKAGTYTVDINHSGIDHSPGLPRQVEIIAGEAFTLDIDIDTGIR
jgi:hypothetical protein